MTDDDDAEAATAPTRTSSGSTTTRQSAPTQTEKIESVSDLTDWKISVDACQDAMDLNRMKKDIGSAKLPDSDFKVIWGWLSSRSKALKCTYDKDAKKFNQQ